MITVLTNGGCILEELLADTWHLLVEGRSLGINLTAVRMAVNWDMSL